VVSPPVLMRQNLREWAFGVCVVSIVPVGATFLAGSAVTPASPHPGRDLMFALCGAVLAAIAIAGASMARGTPLATLADGVVFAPLRQPKVFSIPLEIPALVLPLWIAAAVFVAWLWRARPAWLDAVRFAGGLFAIVLLATFFHKNWLVLPLLPLALIPNPSWRRFDYVPRLFVTTLAATEFVQAYPVSGSQQGISSAVLMLWGFVCVYDAAPGLIAMLRSWSIRIPEGLLKETAIGGLLTLAFAGTILASGAGMPRYPDPPSRLRGASSLHLPAAVEDRYLALAADLRQRCDVLFTLPGMGSLNYWSGVPAPNGLNMTGWVKAFSTAQQEQIIELLRRNPRACAVYNRNLSGFWGMTLEDEDASPLARYIKREMRAVSRYGDYEIRVNTGDWR